MAAEAQEASSTINAPETTSGTATGARRQRTQKKPRQSFTERVKSIRPLELLPGLLLAAAVMALYTYYSLQQMKHWVTPSWDLAIFTQMAQAYSHFSVPIVPIKGPDFNLWGDHFHPILVLLGPIYALFPSPTTLLVVQNALVAFASFAIVRFTQRAFALAQKAELATTGTAESAQNANLVKYRGVIPTITGLLLGAGFALSFGVQQAIAAQFHEVAFAVPLLAMSLGYLVLASRVSGTERARYLAYACWWSLPIAFVKEDMGITVAVIGLIIFIRTGWLSTAVDILMPRLSAGTPAPMRTRMQQLYSSWARTPAVAESTMVMMWGVFWSVVAVYVILPYFNSGGNFDYADKVNFSAALGDPFGSALQMLSNNTKLATLGLLLITGAVLWAISPLAAIALPTLAWRLLSTMESYWASTWHYSLVLMPVVFLALLDAVVRVRYGVVPAAIPVRSAARAADSASAEEPQVDTDPGRLSALARRIPVWALPAVALFLAVSPIFVAGSQQPLASLGNAQFTASALTTTDQMKQDAVQKVPEGVTVASDLSILTQLIPGRTVYWIGHTGEPAPDYVVIDRRSNSWGGNPPANTAQYAADRYGHSYAKYATVGTIDIVRRVD
ncbi:hypothetical protein HMPREF2999_02740 [Rothia sp. HMSC066H02]|uniref:DUF2079 domain-containing protein n=1 Tax=unclassified Rothia (in: high G+C Gram-positive bacteria) TaxID=2689056 RepID=UPI0008A54C90|nr:MULTISPECIES: DUF2079 domain-containing protein [unclassified Rothia (in: high G+C Gram-positive bacteria)]OFO98023.1 hypothetical protein HMPREF3008_05375 [Rothia sp. HMSC065D09]OFP12943.1 hypothetical protein HMPREF2999_02740 [Rothia sp. HMSC066H02]